MSTASKSKRRQRRQKSPDDISVLDLDEAILLAQSADADVVVQTTEIYDIHETRGGNVGYSVAYSHQPEVLEKNEIRSAFGNANTAPSEAVFIESGLLLDDGIVEEAMEGGADEDGDVIQVTEGHKRRKRVCIYLLLAVTLTHDDHDREM